MFSIAGTNLLTIDSLLAKESAGSIVTAQFRTEHISLSLSFNESTCTGKTPLGNIYLRDVTNDLLTIRNLNLDGCTDGSLIGSFVFVRGVRDSVNGQFLFKKEERIYDVNLGKIGCDAACHTCNGITDSDCLLCADQDNKFLFQGRCYDACPTEAPVHTTYRDSVSNLYGK